MIQSLIKILLSTFIIIILSIFIDGHIDSINHSTTGVVFGNKVTINGPSIRLISRLDKAIELYNNKSISKIIVSGGIDKNHLDESQIMYNYLLNKGIPKSNIIKDSLGYNTYKTAKNSLNMLTANEQLLAISQFYHMSRIKLIYKKLGYPNISYAHSNYYELRDFYSILREFFAIIKYMLYY